MLAVLLAAAIIIAAAFLYGRAAPDISSERHNYIFKKGRLWSSIEGSNRGALIDSGTSMSIFPDTWHSLGQMKGSMDISTPFGIRHFPVRDIRSTEIGDRSFRGTVFIQDVSFPIIGNDFIFSSNNVLFMRDGLQFDVDYDPKFAIECVGMVVDYIGNAVESTVGSVYFLMVIDGAEQKVFFDTGLAPPLTATAIAPKPNRNLFPRLEIRHNAMGEWNLSPYFGRRASLLLGGKKKAFFYRHYYRDYSLDTPFVMGAGILKDYSILIDHRNGRACFYPRQR